MRTYSYAKAVINGKRGGQLDVWGEHNVFHVFEYGDNVFTGSHGEVVRYIERWKELYREIQKAFEEAGVTTTLDFEQTIR